VAEMKNTAGSVIHIGYAKCASTFLQKRVFPLVNGYTVLERRQMNPLWRSFLGESEVNQQMKRLYDESVILSAEDITAPTASLRASRYGRTNDYDIFLTNLPKVIGSRTKVLVVIRRQDSLVQSWLRFKPYRYNSPNSFFLDSPGKDLGNKRIKVTSPIGVVLTRSFDFFHSIHRLEAFVRKENIHVLVYEDLLHDPARFFSGLESVFSQSLRSFIASATEKVNQTPGPAPIIGPGGEILIKPIRNLVPKPMRQLGLRLIARDRSAMSAKDCEQVIENYRTSNQRLADWKNLDLGRYGYF
jgi:hypothetical protein